MTRAHEICETHGIDLVPDDGADHGPPGYVSDETVTHEAAALAKLALSEAGYDVSTAPDAGTSSVWLYARPQDS